MATTFATALLRPVLEVDVRLNKLLKPDRDGHPAVSGVPVAARPLANSAVKLLDWWKTMTPPLAGWTIEDLTRGMDRFRELFGEVEAEANRMLEAYGRDPRFPAKELRRMLTSMRMNDRNRFEGSVQDCIASLAGWLPTPAQRGKRVRHSGAREQYTLAQCREVTNDWKSAQSAGETLKVWAQKFVVGAASSGFKIRPGHALEDCLRLLQTCRRRLRREAKKKEAKKRARGQSGPALS